MNLPVQNLKSITDDFRAVYSYFVFPRVRCRFFAHLHQNKPKSLFCPIQERRKPSERGKNGMKVRFSRIFLQIGWSKRPQDIVFYLHLCVKHLPSKIPKKLNCRSHSGAQAPLFSKFALRFCKNVFEKVFYGGKRYYCAFVRCGVWGSKPHPFCHLRP